MYTGPALAAQNAIADKLHDLGTHAVDTNPKTAGWGDLFLAWLVEAGPRDWHFGPDDKTTQDLKKEVGIQNAREAVKKKLAAGAAVPFVYNTGWMYGVNQFWNSLKTANTADEFLGSYDIKVEVQTHDRIELTVTNKTGWESGTRFRKAAPSGGGHQAMVPARDRDAQGIHLGGNMTETWTWRESIQ